MIICPCIKAKIHVPHIVHLPNTNFYCTSWIGSYAEMLLATLLELELKVLQSLFFFNTFYINLYTRLACKWNVSEIKILIFNSSDQVSSLIPMSFHYYFTLQSSHRRANRWNQRGSHFNHNTWDSPLRALKSHHITLGYLRRKPNQVLLTATKVNKTEARQNSVRENWRGFVKNTPQYKMRKEFVASDPYLLNFLLG